MQPAKFRKLLNFATWKFLGSETALLVYCNTCKNQKRKILEDLLKTEKLQKENKPNNNKGHKKITKKIKQLNYSDF